jgi:hypothetical protein
VTVRIGEGCRADTPGAIDRPVEELDAARPEIAREAVGVLDPDGELEARAPAGIGNRIRRDQLMAEGLARRLTIVLSNLNAAEFSSS